MNESTHNKRKITVLPLAVIQVIASAALALSARNGFLHIGVFCIGAAGAMFALQMLVSKSYWYIISAAVSVCAATLIGGILPGIMCVFAVPAGILISVMIKKRSTKMSLVASLDVLYILLFAGSFLLVYLLDGYEFSVNAIISHYSEVMEYIEEAMLESMEGEVMTELAHSLRLTEQELLELINAFMDEMKLTMPAIIISSIGVVAYVTAAFFKLGTVICGCELLLPDPRWETLPSKISAWCFAISYIAYSFSTMFLQSLSVISLVSYSIVIIFSPIMMLMGIKWISSLRSKGLVVTLFVFGSMFMLPLAVVILAFFGVREVFVRHDKIKKQNMKDGQQ